MNAPSQKQAPAPALSAHDKALFEQFRTDPKFALGELIHVEHRDLPGRVIRFNVNYGQGVHLEEIRRMLAFNLKLQVEVARSGQQSYIPKLLERIEKGEKIYDWEIGLRLLKGKSRRAGFSTLYLGMALVRANFLANYPALFMAHEDAAAVAIFQNLHRMYTSWTPKYLHLRLDTKYAATDKFELANGSRFAVRTAGQRGKRERTRGSDYKYVHFSEYAHYESYSDVAAVTSVAVDSAWIVKESTANGASGPFYDEWQQALTIDEAEAAYENNDHETLRKWGAPRGSFKSFFSWLDDPGLQAPIFDWEKEDFDGAALSEYERTLKSKFPEKFTPQKIKWRRVTIQNSCQGHALEPEAFFSQEYPATPEESFQSTGTTVFPHEALHLCELRSKDAKPVLRARLSGHGGPEKAVLGGANCLFWSPPRRSRSYVAGVDAAQGLGKDYHWLVIFDQHDGTYFEEVCSFWSRDMDAVAFGHASTMLCEMYGAAFLTPEIQGGGLALAKTVVLDNRYTRIYHRRSLDTINGNQDPNVFRYGIFTSQQMKDTMIQECRFILSEKRMLLRTPWLIQQMKGFQKIDREYCPKPGDIDDGVMAVVLGLFGAKSAPMMRVRPDDVSLSDAVEELSDRDRAIWAAVAKKVERSMKRAKGQRVRPAPPKKSARARVDV